MSFFEIVSVFTFPLYNGNEKSTLLALALALLALPTSAQVQVQMGGTAGFGSSDPTSVGDAYWSSSVKVGSGLHLYNENLYALSSSELAEKGIARLPTSLPDALDALEKNKVVSGGLGEVFIREFLEVKRAECDELLLNVSPAEFSRYVDFF